MRAGYMRSHKLTRRTLLAAGSALPLPAMRGAMSLCMHQTTTAGSTFRDSLDGYARAGIRYVEVIPPLVDEFVKRESVPAARRLLSDLNLKAVSCGGPRGTAEPHPGRADSLDQLKRIAGLAAELGVDRLVCPCGTAEKYTNDDYTRGVDNLRETGEIVRLLGITAMLEFMRGSTFIGTLPTSLKMTRQAAHPNVRPMLDCYHFWAGLSKFEDLALLQDGEIHHVHFQDVPDIPREQLDNGTRDIPGEGVSPLAAILRKLAEKNYRGPLSVELFYPYLQKGDPYEVASRIRRKAEPILEQAGVL
jgi:2-keto-myo-inositol isomerase